jgi:hypothetical protein
MAPVVDHDDSRTLQFDVTADAVPKSRTQGRAV